MKFKEIKMNQKYNMWKIKSTPFKKGNVYYVKAECECGNIKDVKKNNILTGRSTNCGCLVTDKLVKLTSGRTAWNAKPIDFLAKRELFERYKHDAQKRNYEFKLTKKQFGFLIDDKCKYCGSDSSNEHKIPKRGSYKYNGIDRIDNNIGYVTDNVVTCCKTCNVMKNALQIENFFEHLQKIIKNTNVKPGINENKLDSYYNRALSVASNSHDPDTKVGALLINIDSGAVIAEGYNGFVRGAPDDKLPTSRPEKYEYMMHAEENLLCNAVRHGIKTDNSVLFCTLSPCKKCLRMLWQAGIKIVYFKDKYKDLEYSKKMGDLTFEIEDINGYTRLKYIQK